MHVQVLVCSTSDTVLHFTVFAILVQHVHCTNSTDVPCFILSAPQPPLSLYVDVQRALAHNAIITL